MAYEKLVSTNYKWKVLKRKKPPKWRLISSYKNVLQVWADGLFTDAEFIFPRRKKIKGCITLIIREVEIIFCKNHTSGDRIGTVSLRFYWLFCLRQSKNNSQNRHVIFAVIWILMQFTQYWSLYWSLKRTSLMNFFLKPKTSQFSLSML